VFPGQELKLTKGIGKYSRKVGTYLRDEVLTAEIIVAGLVGMHHLNKDGEDPDRRVKVLKYRMKIKLRVRIY